MLKKRSVRLTAIVLAVVLLLSVVASAALNYDLNGDGKTNIWDLQLALNGGASKEDQDAALNEALGGGDELHKNAEGQWEIYTSLGLYNMAKHAKAGDTFVLKQDIDMEGALWTPIEGFNGKLVGNEYVVSNMKISRSVDGNLAFFGSIAENGYIERLNLSGMNLIADTNTVSIGLVAGTCAGTVDACTAIGFVTDTREILPDGLKVGGLVGTLMPTGQVKTHVENMLHKEGESTSEIPNISAKLAVRVDEANTDVYLSLMKIVGDQGSGAVDSMAALEILNGIMPDPNAIAWVNNGDISVFPLNLSELLAAIDSDGNSVITLQSDIENSSVITLPYSCTLDCNGHTITTNLTSGNGIMVNAAGTDNKTFTLKNGTLRFHTIGARVNKGAVVISNMQMISVSGAPVGIYDTTDYSDVNKIENSTLLSGAYGCIAFNTANADMSATGITITSSKLISAKSGGHVLLVKNSGTKPGTVTLGTNVDLYTYGNSLSADGNIAGEDPVKMEQQATITVDGKTYSGLNHWTTDESLVSTVVIAEVTNGTTTKQVASVKNMLQEVSSTGNTKIKLLKDVTYASSINLPYSCTIDLNGYTLTNSSGDCIVINAVGSENPVTAIKNGTISHKSRGIKVLKGALDLYEVDLIGQTGSAASIAMHDPTGSYRQYNKIENCYIYNPNSLTLYFNEASTDFSNTGILYKNSTMICKNNYLFGMASGATPAVVEFDEHVEMYSNKSKICGSKLYFSGKMAGLTENAKVTVLDSELTLNNWSTDKQTETVNILLLGNSLSTTLPEEIYEIAKSKGIAVTVTDLYHAGACGWQHKEWIMNDSPEYEYRVYNDMGFWQHGDIKTVDGAIAYMDWDHVCYQEWFQKNKGDVSYGVLKDFTMEEALKLFEGYNDWIYDYLKTNIPNAEFYCFQHWSWQVGHGHVPDVATQTKMFEMIQDTTEYFSEKYDVTLIPVGLAFQYARQDSLIGDTLCKPEDMVHDNGPTGGQFLNGCVFFEVMFQKSCIGNTWRGTGNAPTSEAVHQALEQHAHDAVAYYYGEDFAK